MDQKSKVIFLVLCVAAFISAFVFMCRGIMSGKPHTVQHDQVQCHFLVGSSDLLVTLSGSGRIQQVRIQRPDGRLVATYPGCGIDECNYSMMRFEHSKYHVTVVSSVGTFDGNIDW